MTTPELSVELIGALVIIIVAAFLLWNPFKIGKK